MKKTFISGILFLLSCNAFAQNNYNLIQNQKIFGIEHNTESSLISINDKTKSILSSQETTSLQDSQYMIISSISNLMNIFKTMQFLDPDAYKKDIFIVDQKYLKSLVDINYSKLFYSYANTLFIEKYRVPDAFNNTIYNATKAQVTLDNINKNIKSNLMFGDILETQNSIMIKIAYLVKENRTPEEVKNYIDSQKNFYMHSYMMMAEDLKNKYTLMEQAKRMLTQ